MYIQIDMMHVVSMYYNEWKFVLWLVGVANVGIGPQKLSHNDIHISWSNSKVTNRPIYPSDTVPVYEASRSSLSSSRHPSVSPTARLPVGWPDNWHQR